MGYPLNPTDKTGLSILELTSPLFYLKNIAAAKSAPQARMYTHTPKLPITALNLYPV